MDSSTRSSVLAPTTSKQNADGAGPDGPSDATVKTTVALLWERVFAKSPMLKMLVEKYGSIDLARFADYFMTYETPSFYRVRREEFLGVVSELVTKRLGKTVSQNVCDQLRRTSLVSTTDHHSFIQHPYWINSNITNALPYAAAPEKHLHTLITFSFATVSLNNPSGYPKGLLFHGKEQGVGGFVKLPILPDKEKMRMVYVTRPYSQEDLDRAHAALDEKVKEGTVSATRAEQVHAFLHNELGTKEMLAAEDLNEQITKLNWNLWPRLFKKEENSHLPNLLYIEIETIVRELLIRHHFSDRSSSIHALLFTPEGRERAHRLLEGLPGMFSTAEKTGTFFFWAADAKGHRVRLDLVDGHLVSDDGSISIAFEPEALTAALKRKAIMPAMGLCYLMVGFYYGFSCIGGFSQIRDMSLLKKAWSAWLHEGGFTDEAAATAGVDTMLMSAGGMVLAYIPTDHHTLVMASGLDMLFEPNLDTRFSRYRELAKKVSFQASMEAILLDTYRVFYADGEREEALLRYSSEDITRATGLYSTFLS